ncbi:hypothetical protein [Granulicella arctica]|uniref:Uncharacterized protein n=1 Tax=Granulicella arctica TaxID=940613 RepID=A0A7Y9PEC3_9BACT|nr:hypothetical protein [Granulicella arctica]NYF78242.1 hypothetical protein [Granulicella arctica]
MSTNLPSFEKAEYGGGSQLPPTEQCVRCGQTLVERFFRMDGEPICEPCANMAVQAPAEGAYIAFSKAIAAGIVAAVVGSALYAAVEIGTGWTIGYVALAVGWLIGKGMKLGSEGRGGRRYQIAAAVLTYVSVSSASLIVILHATQKANPELHFAMSQRFAIFLLKYGLLSPFLELRDGVSGVIGLFILFIGIRTAWAMTAGSEYRITGPHGGAAQS